MADHTPAQEQIRKRVTVVVCDIGGSTTLAERLDTESLKQVIGDYLDRMRRVLERHEATVERFLGSAIMGVFGLPRSHEDDAMRALLAAVKIREEVATLNADLQRRWGVPIALRTGVYTGTVIAGVAVTDLTTIGEAVSLAIRFQQAAHPGEIILAEETYRLVRHAVTVEPVAPLVVEDNLEPVGAVRLLKVAPAAHGSGRRLSSRMVGRDRELNLLHEAFERSIRDRTCHLFTLLGTAGVGKSRLIHEFTSTIQERATILSGRCLPYGDGITMWPVIDVIRQAVALAHDDSPEVVHDKLMATLLRDEQERGRLIAERVASLLGSGNVVGMPEEYFWAVRKVLEAVAHHHPLAVIFDDLHWGEPTFLDLIEHLVDWSRDAPILVVCVARPELFENRANWGGGKANATSITLERLTDAECRRLLANLLGETGLADAALAHIGDSADGNPLFIEELLAMLIDDGLLRKTDKRWKPTGDLARISIPPTIQALLSARLEQLEADERTTIERAAVIGKVFYLSALQHLLPESVHPGLRDSLRSLIRKDLIRPFPSDLSDEEAFQIRHILIRDAAYDALPKAPRAELHEQFALWLERRSGQRAKEYEEIVAHHLEKAYRYRTELGLTDERGHRLARRAVELLARAGHRAVLRGDMSAAVNIFSRATQLLPAGDPVRLDLSIRLGEALAKIGRFETADEILNEVLIEAADNPGLEAHALVEQIFVRISTQTEGGLDEALNEAKRAITLFEELHDEQGLIRAWNVIAEVSNIQGHMAGRQEAAQQSLSYARKVGDEREEAWAIWGVIGAMALGPTPAEQVIQFAESQLAWAVAHGYRWLEVGALLHLGSMHAMRGRFEQARRLLAESRSVSEDLGLEIMAAAGRQISGAVEQLAGDLPAAEREFRRGYEALEALGEKSYLSTIAAQLAGVLYAEGQYETAEQFAKASQAAATADDIVSQVLWRGTEAKVLVTRGASQEAERLAEEALRLARQTDVTWLHGQALVDLAEVRQLTGHPKQAAELLDQAGSVWERKGNLAARLDGRAKVAMKGA
jgi:predicted ATPase/class 3 adenylate cyclase